ncbi:ROK family transcriptional regulator [Planomonospora algeriensis]
MAGETPGSQGALREANQRRVLRAIRVEGSLTQAEIARLTGLSAATVSNIVKDLRGSGAVVVTPTSRGGRRAQSVSLARGAGLVVGVQIGPGRIHAVLCDQNDEILAEERIAYNVEHSAERGIKRAEWLIDTLLRQARADREKVRGVGVAAAGALLGAGRMPAWRGTDLRAELVDRLGLDVHLMKEADAGALGELVLGAGRGIRDFVYVQLSDGVDSGLVLGGRPYPGAGGFSGEIGHLTLDEHGRICRCGNRGCLETVVGGPALLELLPRDTSSSLPMLVGAARDGDPGSRRVIADAGRAVGSAVAVLCNVLNPRRVIIGGELAEAGDLLLDPLREATRRQAAPEGAGMLEITLAGLGDRAPVLGAVASVHRADADPVASDE